jgi:hypothetical protein
VTYDEWADLVDRLNVGFPRQQIDHLTAEVWYAALRDYTRAELGRALARCLADVEFISCHALVEAVKEERRERSATRSTALPLPPRSANIPPEWKAIRETLERGMLLPGHPDHLPREQVRERIEELHRYLEARLAEGTMAPRRDAIIDDLPPGPGPGPTLVVRGGS